MLPERRHMRQADITAILIAVALLTLYLFAPTSQIMQLEDSGAGWLLIVAIILGFFGLGTLLHSLVQACRIQLRMHRPKSQ